MAKKLKNSSFLTLLAASAFLLITVYLVASKNLNFNINSSAGRNRYSLNGTLVYSSTFEDCRLDYMFGVVDSSGKKCTSLVIDESLASPYVEQRVQLKGALKDDVFYVTSIKALVTQNTNQGTTPPGGTDRPQFSPRPYPEETDYPIPYPDPVKSKPVPTISVPPPRF